MMGFTKILRIPARFAPLTSVMIWSPTITNSSSERFSFFFALLIPSVSGFMALATYISSNLSTARATRSELLFETTTTGIPAFLISKIQSSNSSVPSGLFQAINVLSKSVKTALIPSFFNCAGVIL